MGDFSWSLDGNDAIALDPQEANPQPVAPVFVVSAQSAEEKPLSRRELRHRAQAGVVERMPESAPESRREARVRRAETSAVAAAGVQQSVVPQSAIPRTAVASESHAVRRRVGKGKFTRQRGAVAASRGGSTASGGRDKVGRRRALFSKLFSISAMLGVGALMVSTTLPANAFYDAAGAAGEPTTSFTSHSQSMRVAPTAVEAAASRDSYTVSSLVEQLRLKYGNRSYSYTNDINGTIQWPFPVPVPISSGYGPRISPCGGCSSVHQGVDFAPGRGVAIGAIADGVVSQVVATHSGWGNHVVVDHVINGQKVQSLYAHMLDNSFAVTVGQKVTVGQTLGHVGSTGESTGAHMHLEIHINGIPVDPFAWLKANAN